MSSGIKRSDGALPSKEELLRFIEESPHPVGKREIARAFSIKGKDRPALKELLREIRTEGSLEDHRSRKLSKKGRLPAVTVLEILGIDEDGETLARPHRWDREGKPPRIYVAPGKRGRPALAVGERLLARLRLNDDGSYDADTIRVLTAPPRRLLGIYEKGENGGRLRPTDRRAKEDFRLDSADAGGAQDGELVLTEVLIARRATGRKQVRVVERLGSLDNVKALSLISIHEHGLPTEFSRDALEEAEQAGPAALDEREDLRNLPLVTIDGADARDFDDAVWAEPDEDPKNAGGWRLIVAIADVGHYVKPGSALDQNAYERGNSTYLPDRVVPMLPEAISNGWCSLVPGEDRPCLAVRMWIDREGRLLRYRFVRGLMRSGARLIYEEVQAARDGRPDKKVAALVENVIQPLYGAYEALLAARQNRGTLDLDLPEEKVVFASDGDIAGIEPRQRLDSHRLIEEFMISANVAAAMALEELRQPCMYRVHEEPDPVKLDALRQILQTFGLKLARGQVVRPSLFARLLEQAAGKPFSSTVSELILRAQSQAIYSPANLGHFGLALPRYAHFTSPIRRYADLLVHRGLIKGLGLGAGALSDQQATRFEEMARHVSMTERRSQAAERDAVDRFAAAFLEQKVGEIFNVRVTSVTRFGLFVRIEGAGSDALIPISSLPDDRYDHDERKHCLVGRRWGRVFKLGERHKARLSEADRLTGGLVMRLLEAESEAELERDAESTKEVGKDAWHPLARPAQSAKTKRSSRGKRPVRKGKVKRGR